ncbi:HAD family hydrolase [Allostreptomyces psammosilenae]|uniref:HAD superfamily hydrolase (TIGR01490 family) n=1 Tax=Allostreptomyces psammosilenae TaxID=1892865 RepID=A0A852ZTV7_9ACTN|nr:HAD-IB family hydrolase [Allostreptomyces psammosilenae]NYI05759.1 HAD superfamily hydrolase (TIGR01490 family) [Allostreptomyces psammosilenae]
MAARRRLTTTRSGGETDTRAALAGRASATYARIDATGTLAPEVAAPAPRAPGGPAQQPAQPGRPAPSAETVRRRADHPARGPEAGHPAAAAFFDLDNTVMQGAAIFHLARGLYARKFFQTRDLLRFAWQQTAFRVHGAENMGHIADVRQSALSIVKGRSVQEITDLCEQIFDEHMSDKIWPGTRALVQLHLDAGQRVWLVTAAPVETAREIARRLGMTGALGTVSEAVDGHYTGRLVGEPLHGQAKAEAVKALAVTEGLDLGRCAAYSDSANDVPMLSLVGHPYAINPDARLRRHAKEHGWRVHDYRTGRKALRLLSLPVAGVALVGGATAGALRRRRQG